MKSFLISIIFLVSVKLCFANVGWWFVGSKDGITIIVPCAYDDSVKERKQQKAFLDLLVKKLNRKDTSLKILLLVNPIVMYPSSLDLPNKWFASIAYDTLRRPDNNFIEDYNLYRSKDSVLRLIEGLRNSPSDKYKINLPEPIDINSSYNMEDNQVGLKVICAYVHWDSVSSYDKFYTLIRYGIDHIDEIKRDQKRIVIPFHLNDIKISLMTIDTGMIKSLPILSLGFDPKMQKEHRFPWIWLVVSVGVVLLVAFMIKFRVLR